MPWGHMTHCSGHLVSRRDWKRAHTVPASTPPASLSQNFVFPEYSSQNILVILDNYKQEWGRGWRLGQYMSSRELILYLQLNISLFHVKCRSPITIHSFILSHHGRVQLSYVLHLYTVETLPDSVIRFAFNIHSYFEELKEKKIVLSCIYPDSYNFCHYSFLSEGTSFPLISLPFDLKLSIQHFCVAFRAVLLVRHSWFCFI